MFYFRPGHETYPIYYDKNVMQVLTNAVRWARPSVRIKDACPHVEKPMEPVGQREVDLSMVPKA